MDTELEHSSFVRRLISAAAILALSTFIFLPGTSAQINGVPASVTSIGFGGNFDRAPGPPASVTSLGFGGQFGRTFGPPASVTSLGPNGLQGRQFFTTPDCCINPLFPSAADQPQTVLVFKDGHQAEIQNYAVVGQTLYDLSPGHYRKIALAELDLKATAKENDDRGISFQLPPGAQGN